MRHKESKSLGESVHQVSENKMKEIYRMLGISKAAMQGKQKLVLQNPSQLNFSRESIETEEFQDFEDYKHKSSHLNMPGSEYLCL